MNIKYSYAKIFHRIYMMYIMNGVICHILAKALRGHVYCILIHHKKLIKTYLDVKSLGA